MGDSMCQHKSFFLDTFLYTLGHFCAKFKTESEMRTLAYSLRDRRLELGLTLEDVAQSVGVGKSTVRKWETGFIQNMGRDKILALAKVLRLSPMDIIDPDEEIPESMVHSISEVVGKLQPDRQKNVYDYATDQLHAQSHPQKVVPFKVPTPIHYTEVQLLGVVSAGTGEFQVDGDEQPTIQYPGRVPGYDYALRVNGDSMYPMLEDNQVIFVRHSNGSDVHTGQIVIALLNDCAFVKKIDLDEGRIRLISLNPKYKPIEVDEDDDFQIQGTVVL